MDLKPVTIRSFLLLLCITAAGAIFAQTSADSVAIVDARWKVMRDADGVVVKKWSPRLFGSDQRIFCVEIDPAEYRLALAQDSLRTRVSELGRQSGAEVAINGGFFKTRTDEAVASGFIRIGDRFPARMPGNYGAAVVIDSTGYVSLVPWSDAVQTQYDSPETRYSEVLTTGPALVRNGYLLIGWNAAEPRHPRSCIGVRPDGTVVLMVVDGRQKKAAGMGLCELAYLTRLMGMSDVLNLDGGGSSTLWTKRQGVINKTSDHVLFFRMERPVGNAVVVKKR